ncbi:TetR/AcrR family transcriptional regulator [Nocardia jinanensis]|uniref:TetR family transcriptional regulator n=1 Tax=Nocardia jinanensis TaxID=382504 RepID=A0A917VWI1_9NOCA|nr:TetR/AcrR family transcriptional regulator [Nocardia jinanensis]GGL35641.1 TetR family transcriptional regulator [Nocardia jinanensis]
MGAKGAETRQRMIEATRSSIERRGYFGTGLNQILTDSETPRGSLYFHFPGGKDELVAAAVTQSSGLIDAALDAADFTDPAGAAAGLITLLADRLEASGWENGCPVATVALEVSGTNDTVQRACAQVYTRWTEALRIMLRAAGHHDAEDLAVALLALVEGALLLARTHRSRDPLDRAARVARTLL